MKSLTESFIKLIQSTCQKGQISDLEREIIIIAGKEIDLSQEQIIHLMDIYLSSRKKELLVVEKKAEDDKQNKKSAQKNNENSSLTKNELNLDFKKFQKAKDVYNTFNDSLKSIIDNLFFDVYVRYAGLYPEEQISILSKEKIYKKIISKENLTLSSIRQHLPDFPNCTFHSLIENFILKTDITKVKGISERKIINLYSSYEKLVDIIIDMDTDRSLVNKTMFLFSLEKKDKTFLDKYYQSTSSIPIFWLLSEFILKTNSDMKGEIAINALSQNPIEINSVSIMFNLKRQRIEQILYEFIDEKFNKTINKFKVYLKALEIDVETEVNDLIESFPMLNEQANKLNISQNTFFNVSAISLVLYLLNPKLGFVGDRKIVFSELFSTQKLQTDHRWSQIYLISNNENCEVIRSAIYKISKICAEKYGEKNISIQHLLTNEEVSLIIKNEGNNWQQKKKVNGKYQASYTDMSFEITKNGYIQWKNSFSPQYEKLMSDVKRVFYELRKDKPILAKEALDIYFCENNNYGLSQTKENIITRYAKELGLINISNMWMTTDYALEFFDKGILELKKINFRDAIYYRLLKDKSLQGNDLNFWIDHLNKILNKNTQRESLSNKDLRFTKIKGEKKGRHLIYLKETN